MITAVDTNVLFDVVLPNQTFARQSIGLLSESVDLGTIVICDIVYAELCGYFATREACDVFLIEAQMKVQSLSREALFLASEAFQDYRRQGGKRTRILPDFLVGAHAALQAQRLLSRDRGFYRNLFTPKLFPSLKIIGPSALT